MPLKKKIFIHIGTGKTATTTIQKTLNIYSQRNVLNDFLYPDIGSYNHHDLVILVQDYERLPRTVMQKFESHDAYKTAQDNLKKKLINQFDKSKNILISSEYLSTLSKNEIFLLKKELDTIGDFDVKICIYVRDPILHYKSYVQQICKASTSIHNPNKYRYDFKGMILRWKSYFPNIVVRPFAKDKLVGNCIFQDFMCLVNDFFNIKSGAKFTPEISNESLSLESLSILVNYRKYFYSGSNNVFAKDSNHLISILTNIDKKFNTTKLILKDVVANKIYLNHKEELQWLNEHYHVDFTRTDFYDDSSDIVSPIHLNKIFIKIDEQKITNMIYEIINILILSKNKRK
jgi:hypothetical protein